jgi:hypothetical protein
MKMRIEFEMDNAAFADETDDREIQGILDNIALQYKNRLGGGNVMDSNGNTIGKWEIEE